MRLPFLLRRALGLLAVLAMLTTMTATAAVAAPQFTDVDGGVFDPAITALAERGIVDGYTDREFGPARTLTRGQLATVLDATRDLPPAEADHFADDDDSVHEDAIDRVAAAGIARGDGDGQFRPEEPVTRGEIGAMVAESFDVPAGDTAYFGDLGDVHASRIRAIANAGVAAGCADGRFCPTAQVLRGEAALFVARAMDLVDPADPITLEEHEANVAERREVLAAQQEEIRQAEEAAAEQERLRIWERLAECESGGNWSINTGNGYYGGLQFSLSSWRAVGGSGYPHNASKAEQIRRGERLQDLQGWGAWPTCSRKIGLR